MYNILIETQAEMRNLFYGKTVAVSRALTSLDTLCRGILSNEKTTISI